MMKKTLLSLLFASVATLAFPQFNMTLLDAIDYGTNANDIWGWVDPDDGTEYALVGLRDGLSIVDLTDPEDVVEVQFVPGPNSTWRDIKTWGNHVYVTNETGNGLLVVDMSDAPDSITWYEWAPDLPDLGQLSSCHNLYIDEFGYCYLSGCNINGGGMVVLDVFSDPGNPIYVAPAPPVYAHDVYVRDNKMYASEIYAGSLSIYDVSDKQNITLLGSTQTPYTFTHNAWLNDAGDVAFTTDEKGNAPVTSYDVSDPADIVELDQFRPIATLGQGVIPHNVHVWNDWLIISYYTDGGIIADASRPENIIEVGNWDTFLGGNGGFNGVWGAYPFLPSGIVLLTDIGTGLYVVGANYVRACWLEGKVTDANTGAPIFGASVEINSAQPNIAETDLIGRYKTGQAMAGTFNVVFSATGYYSKSVQAVLENGVLTELNVELEPFSSFDVTGHVREAAGAAPVPGAVVFLDGDEDFTLQSDANGDFTFTDVPNGNYTLYATQWGYLLEVIPNFAVNDQTGPVTIELNRGYQDDFVTDLGWEYGGNAITGFWERGEPVGTLYNGLPSNPEYDIPSDFGTQCYVTGNGGGSAGDDDVDGGTVVLVSPPMDLTGYLDPVVSYYTWFFNEGGNSVPNDTLVVRITNGVEEVVLETISNSAQNWRPQSSFHLAQHIAITNDMRIVFETADLPGSGHLVEAAVDAFRVVDKLPYPDFSISDLNGCAPQMIEFADMSDSTTSWQWTFQGGNPATSTDPNPVVEYTTPGIFDVTLEATTASGQTFTLNRFNSIVIGMAPVADFSLSIAGQTVTFVNNSTGGGDFFWEFGDGANSTESNPSHTYTAPGVYTVNLTMTNDCGSDFFSRELEIMSIPPTAAFSANATEGCAPFIVAFTDQSAGSPETWEWSFPGGDPATSTEPNPTVVYNTPGTYNVILTVSNAAGTTTSEQMQYITVLPQPTAGFSFDVTNAQVTFTNTSTNADSYSWDFGDGTTSNEADPVHTYTAAGDYEVTLSVTNECGTTVLTQQVSISEVSAVEYLNPEAFRLSVTPNPFHNSFVLKYDLRGHFHRAKVVVFNVLGQPVGSVPLTTDSGVVRIGEGLSASGVYFVRLIVDGKIGKAVRVVKL